MKIYRLVVQGECNVIYVRFKESKMSRDVIQENVDLGYYGNQTDNYLDFVLQIFEADSITTPKFLKQSKHIQWIVCVVSWTFLSIGSYFRYILYSHLFNCYKTKENKPIDTLILIISLIQHINIALFVIRITLFLLYDANLDKIGLQSFCMYTALIYHFDVCYSCVGREMAILHAQYSKKIKFPEVCY